VNGRVLKELASDHLSEALADVMSSHECAVSLGEQNHQIDRDYLCYNRPTEGFASLRRELVNAKMCS
jgi:hypothetical protein